MNTSDTNHLYYIDSKKLTQYCFELLKAVGADDFSASTTSGGIVLASLRGVDSHGVQLLTHYIKALQKERLKKSFGINFKQTSTSTGILDADHSLGFPAGVTAINQCIKMAQTSGIGAVSVINSTHGGMLAYYTLPAAEQGFFALAVTNTTPRLIPSGARKPFLGTNPVCYAFPLRDEGPLCYDSATTQITGNKIQLYKKTGKNLPEGVAADSNGNPTTDPNLAELLMPFGDYKGFGIALLVDILCGVLTGMPNSENVSAMYGSDLSSKRYLGQFFMVIDIEKFRSIDLFVNELQDEINRLRNLPAINKQILAPGDPEKEIYRQRIKNGIPLPDEIFEDLQAAGKRFHIDSLEVLG